MGTVFRCIYMAFCVGEVFAELRECGGALVIADVVDEAVSITNPGYKKAP